MAVVGSWTGASDRNWRLCLDILKDEAQLLGCYPAKVSELEAIRQLVDANVVPVDVLGKISAGISEFQRTALEAFNVTNNGDN